VKRPELTEFGRVHVAGIIDDAEAEMLIGCGVTHLGFPLTLDYHREDLSPEAAAAIVARHGDRATFFLITYLNRADEIAVLAGKLGVGMVQLHGEIGGGELERLRVLAPDLNILKSLIVRGNNEAALIEAAERLAPLVDAFITDTFDRSTGASGATGKVHDWAVSRALVKACPKPVILAGGLNPDNVGAAIRAVRPAGVDVHTGIEGVDGRKRRDLTLRFVAEARAAFAEIDVSQAG
jgi:phosphoribosylanthranilate isomerase